MQNSRKIIYSLGLMIVIGLILWGLYENPYENFESYTYIYETRQFSFIYPEGWTVEERPVWEATETQEASPDWGVRLYPEEGSGNWVKIFGAYSKLSTVGQAEFTDTIERKGQVIAEVYTEDTDETIWRTIYYYEDKGAGDMHALIKWDTNTYAESEQTIELILESVKPGE